MAQSLGFVVVVAQLMLEDTSEVLESVPAW